MMNFAAAAFGIATRQFFARARILVGGLLFLIPVALAGLIHHYSRGLLPVGQYSGVIATIYIMGLVPFAGIYWGSSVLSDEIEGKTLVFLWTRPAGRARILLLKFIVMSFWLCAMMTVSAGLVFFITHSGLGFDVLFRNLPRLGWDLRSLLLSGITYAALGFLLATLVKRPLIWGLAYVYTFDFLSTLLPGFLQRMSLRHYAFVLCSNPGAGGEETGLPEKMMSMLSGSDTTETQAVFTLLVLIIIFLTLGALMLKNREFLGDDPARAQ